MLLLENPIEIVNRKIRQRKSQSNISSKRKGQVKKLLPWKITYATRSKKIIKKQPPEVFCKKKVYLKFSQCKHRETFILESHLNKLSGLKPSNFIKKRFHRRFPVNISNLLWTAIFKNICERLLLIILWSSSWKAISDKCLYLLSFKRSI